MELLKIELPPRYRVNVAFYSWLEYLFVRRLREIPSLSFWFCGLCFVGRNYGIPKPLAFRRDLLIYRRSVSGWVTYQAGHRLNR